MRVQYRFFALGLLSIFLVHCAKGAVLSESGAGAGAGSGDGGDGGEGSTTGQGGNPNGSGGATTSHETTSGAGGETTGSTSSSSSSSSTTSSSSSTSSTSSTTSSSTTTSSTTSSTTTSSSTTTTTSSSTTTTTSSSTVVCDPLNPGPGCGAAAHCFPQPNGVPVCQGPVGSVGKYGGCLDPGECQAHLNCIDTGDIFFLPCCLNWCTSNANCGAGETCVYLATKVYVGGVEYGVCYDGGGGCL